MREALQNLLGGPVQADLALSVILIVVLAFLRWAVLRAIVRSTDDTEVWYRARKTSTYTAVILGAALLAGIWVGAVNDIATFLGLVSAGIAIALADLLKNLAGWVFIVARRPFRVGDRIQMGDHAGDVIDLRVGRFSILEIGNWVHADQSTGRIIHIPNGKIFTDPLSNYTEGFEFIWHEIEVLITFESDWKKAEEMLRAALQNSAPDVTAQARQTIRRAAREYQIKYTHITPTVYVTVKDSGIMLTGRLLIDPRRRRSVEQSLWRQLLDAIEEEPDVALAYPTIRTYFEGPIELRQAEAARPAEGPPADRTPGAQSS